MVMNSDARHPKEFSTENTLGGNFVLPLRHWLPSVRFGLFAVNGDWFFSLHRAPLAALFTPCLSSSSTGDEPSSFGLRVHRKNGTDQCVFPKNHARLT